MSSDRPWSEPDALTVAPADVSEPALLVSGDILHLVFVVGKTLYHTRLSLADPSAEWLPPVRFASGEAPALAATTDGKLHCAFTNWFLGNCEVYCVTWDGQQWTLPQVVSRTSGVSTSPALAAGPDGSLHAAWADTTPGCSTIYYGRQGDVAWTSGPVPNGAGSCPTLSVGPEGEVIVAWQDRLSTTGCYEIFCAEHTAAGWSVPHIVSDTAQQHSLYPRLAVNSQGHCHLVWQEETGSTYTICGAERLAGSWTPPTDASDPGTDCRLARLNARAGDIFQVFWTCGCALKHRARPAQERAFWWQAETVHANCDGISDLAVTLSPTGTVYAAWSAYGASGQRQLYFATRAPVPMQGVFVPIVIG